MESLRLQRINCYDSQGSILMSGCRIFLFIFIWIQSSYILLYLSKCLVFKKSILILFARSILSLISSCLLNIQYKQIIYKTTMIRIKKLKSEINLSVSTINTHFRKEFLLILYTPFLIIFYTLFYSKRL